MRIEHLHHEDGLTDGFIQSLEALRPVGLTLEDESGVMLRAIKAWDGNLPQYERWLKNNHFTFLGEGRTSRVFLDKTKSFVVKAVKPDGVQVTFDCYLNIDNFAPYAKGSSGNKELNEYFSRVKNLWHELLLFPTMISEDFRCCAQRYVPINTHKALAYVRERLVIPDNPAGNAYKSVGIFSEVFGGRFPLGPIDNIAWCEEEKRPYIIDLR